MAVGQARLDADGWLPASGMAGKSGSAVAPNLLGAEPADHRERRADRRQHRSGQLDDIAPGTAFSDLPDDWECPICGAGKEDFVKED